MTDANLFLPYGLCAAYCYHPYGVKGSKVITLEVWESEGCPQSSVVPAWRPTPPAYHAQLIIHRSSPPRIVVSGDGINAATADPAKFAGWVKQTLMFFASATTHAQEAHEAVLRMGHRDVPHGTLPDVDVRTGRTPPPKQLQEARDHRRVASERPRGVGDGTDQGLLFVS